MTIDHTILEMIDHGISPEELFAAICNGAAEVESVLLDQIATEAIAEGWDESAVRNEIKRQAARLAASRERRLGGIREQLAARTHMQ
jgi:hypothetical protein